MWKGFWGNWREGEVPGEHYLGQGDGAWSGGQGWLEEAEGLHEGGGQEMGGAGSEVRLGQVLEEQKATTTMSMGYGVCESIRNFSV